MLYSPRHFRITPIPYRIALFAGMAAAIRFNDCALSDGHLQLAVCLGCHQTAGGCPVTSFLDQGIWTKEDSLDAYSPNASGFAFTSVVRLAAACAQIFCTCSSVGFLSN